MIQRTKIDIILLIIGLTFLIYSILGVGYGFEETDFRFLLGIEFTLGSLYLILSPENQWR
jgi:hypothetical protein